MINFNDVVATVLHDDLSDYRWVGMERERERIISNMEFLFAYQISDSWTKLIETILVAWNNDDNNNNNILNVRNVYFDTIEFDSFWFDLCWVDCCCFFLLHSFVRVHFWYSELANKKKTESESESYLIHSIFLFCLFVDWYSSFSVIYFFFFWWFSKVFISIFLWIWFATVVRLTDVCFFFLPPIVLTESINSVNAVYKRKIREI